jgi:MFS family permease
MGPALGGWLTYDYSWRWILYINLPVGVLCTLGILVFIRKPSQKQQQGYGSQHDQHYELEIIDIGDHCLPQSAEFDEICPARKEFFLSAPRGSAVTATLQFASAASPKSVAIAFGPLIFW